MPQYDFRSRDAGREGSMRQGLVRTARAAALAVLCVCAYTAMARAGDDDPNATQSSGGSIYDKMLDVVGLGGQGTIQYSERSPLVVPPTRDLPPPGANAPPVVPNWPKDPDMERSKQTKVKEKSGPNPNWVIENSRPLRPDELRNPAGTTPANPTTPNTELSPADYPDQIERSKKSIFSFDVFKKEQYATFTGEPTRGSLTDPPVGYQTPSPDQPYGIGPEKRQNKIPTVADRVTPTSGSSSGQ
jgi:hypothetical protein